MIYTLVKRKAVNSQDKFGCTSCGHQANAGINASENILAAGHTVLAGGEGVLETLMQQEPFGASNLVSS